MFFSNKLILMLFILLLAVWGSAIFQIVGSIHFNSKKEKETPQPVASKASTDLPLLDQKKIVFDSAMRDPFKSYLYVKKKVVRKTSGAQKPAKAKKPSKKVAPPSMKVNGILWGPNPVAILEKGGKTELVKKGAKVWGFTVRKVGKHGVVVEKEGKEFVLIQ